MIKVFEVRDSGTFIPVAAFSLGDEILSPQEHWLVRRAGFARQSPGSPQVFLMRLTDAECHYDCYEWKGGTRTLPVAHDYLQKHWHDMEGGEVIDVQFILGETTEKKQSEALTT